MTAVAEPVRQLLNDNFRLVRFLVCREYENNRQFRLMVSVLGGLEDAVSEAYQLFLEVAHKYQPGRATLGAWFVVVLRRAFTRRVGRHALIRRPTTEWNRPRATAPRRLPRLQLTASLRKEALVLDPRSEEQAAPDLDALKLAWGQLTNYQRCLLRRRLLEHRSKEDLAAEFHINLESVRRNLDLAVRRLRRWFRVFSGELPRPARLTRGRAVA